MPTHPNDTQVGQEIRCQTALGMLPDGSVVQDDIDQVFLVENGHVLDFDGCCLPHDNVNLPATIIAIDAY